MVAEFFCSQCNAPFLNSNPLDAEGRCRLCRDGLTGFQRAFTFGEYDGTLRKLIHLFKYGRIEPLAQPLGAMLSQAMPRNVEFDAIVPMPLHWFRRWRRGFNQSELLADVLSKRTGLPVVSHAMTRRKSTAPQAGLSGAQRRLNVSGAFAVKRRHLIEGRRVLLVDDVMTTGATAGLLRGCAPKSRRQGRLGADPGEGRPKERDFRTVDFLRTYAARRTRTASRSGDAVTIREELLQDERSGPLAKTRPRIERQL